MLKTTGQNDRVISRKRSGSVLTRSYKYLNEAEIGSIIESLTEKLEQTTVGDEQIAKDIIEILLPETLYYRDTQIKQIVQGMGSESSPLRLAITKGLRHSFEALIEAAMTTTNNDNIQPFAEIIEKNPKLGMLHMQPQCKPLQTHSKLYANGLHPETIATQDAKQQLMKGKEVDTTKVRALISENAGCANHHMEELLSLMAAKTNFADIRSVFSEFILREVEIANKIEELKKVIMDHTTDTAYKITKLTSMIDNMVKGYTEEEAQNELARIVQGDGDVLSPLRLAIYLDSKTLFDLLFDKGLKKKFSTCYRETNHYPADIHLLMLTGTEFNDVVSTIWTPSPMSSPKNGALHTATMSAHFSRDRVDSLSSIGIGELTLTMSHRSVSDGQAAKSQVDFLNAIISSAKSSDTSSCDSGSSGSLSTLDNSAKSPNIQASQDPKPKQNKPLILSRTGEREDEEGKKHKLGNGGLGGETPNAETFLAKGSATTIHDSQKPASPKNRNVM
jgi:hypothetical protein